MRRYYVHFISEKGDRMSLLCESIVLPTEVSLNAWESMARDKGDLAGLGKMKWSITAIDYLGREDGK